MLALLPFTAPWKICSTTPWVPLSRYSIESGLLPLTNVAARDLS